MTFQAMTFQEIINGEGNVIELDNKARYTFKEIAERIECKDGTTLSVQASHTHYCTPRTDTGPYSAVEVGYPTADPPDSWLPYADGDEIPSDVYGYVPVEMVREFIEMHGGESR